MEYGLVVLWLFAYLGLGALALPATAWLFDRFPGKGAGFALPAALATLGFVGYWVGQVRFGYPALVAGLAVLAAVSGLALYRGVRPDPREYGEAMAVFVVAFVLLVAIRAYDPAVHPGGGEKFLDFGLLNSLLRAGRLPPEDIWFAGDAMPYYYGGHMITALLAWLTDTAPRYAYNLALAGWYGSFVTAAYALAGAIADRTGRPRRSAGLLGAFFVGVASNLVTPLRFLAWAVPGGRALAGAVGVPLTGLANGPNSFEYWSAHLVIPGTNNEFPFFAFLNGDMHAHMMSPTFTLLLGAALLAYWWAPAAAVWRRRAIVLGVVPPLGGLIALVNTWSLPTVAGLTFLALVFAPTPAYRLLPARASRTVDRLLSATPRADGGTARSAAGPAEATPEARPAPAPATAALREAVRIATALGTAGVATVLAALLVYPYMAMSTAGRGVGFVDGQSGLWGLVLVHGVFLAITGLYFIPRLDPGEGHRGRAFVLLSILVVVLSLAGVVPVVPFLVVLGAGWLLARSDDVDFEAVLAVGALGLVVLVEFVRVTNAGPGRYNTVFKVYAQVWALWAVAAGTILAGYVDPVGYLRGLVDEFERDDPDPDEARPTYAGVLAAALVVSLSLYAGFALFGPASGHFQRPASDDGATLDALAFVEEDHPEEAEAIRWVRDLEGQPNIASAPTACMYRWTTYRVDCGGGTVVGASAAASLSGVPTLAGWYHEIGYRGEEEFLQRVRDVRTIYDGTPAEQARLLAEHEVEYVYVGPAERDRYENYDFARRLEGVEIAHQSGAVTIYRVDPDRVAPAQGVNTGSGGGNTGSDGGNSSAPEGGTGSGSGGPTG